MTKIIRIFSLLSIITGFATSSSFAQKADEDIKINKVISTYAKTLNSNDINGILQLFSEDGALVLQGTPTSTGAEAIKKTYTSLLGLLSFNLNFRVEEVVQMSPQWAFVMTTTSGTNHIRSNNSEIQVSGHELFVLKKEEGTWKIARYAGSSTK